MHVSYSIPRYVYLLGLTIFCMTTAEFMVAGMMPVLAAALGVSLGQVGNLIALYALGMALGGPVMTSVTLVLGWSNRRALLCMLGVYVVTGAVAALATDYTVMALGRIGMGVASAAAIGASISLGAEQVPENMRGRAASLVLGGLMLSPVLGVPATAWIAQQVGWRVSFWAVVVWAIVCAVCIVKWVPAARHHGRVSLADEWRAILNRQLWAAYLTSGLIIGSVFAAVSYALPILTGLTGLNEAVVPALLALYGVGNVVGNIVVGRLADRHTLPVLAWGAALMVAALGVFAWGGQHASVAIPAFLLLGLTGVALNPAMSARVMRAARPSALVNTMHTSAITGGLAFGAWAGGLGIDVGQNLTAPLWLGAALAVLAGASLVPVMRRARREACMAHDAGKASVGTL